MAENVTPVTLKIDGLTDREVLAVEYTFNKATDMEGQIAGNPRGGVITVKVKALNDGNSELVAWMVSNAPKGEVGLEFVNTKDGKAMKTLKGKTVFCTKYNEKWEEGVGHFEEITLSCKILENGAVSYENTWK